MRGGGTLALLSLFLLAPFAVAETFFGPDPQGDENTFSTAYTSDAQPRVVTCHDASIDIAGVQIDRSEMVRVTYSFHGPLAAPLLTCNHEETPVSQRRWDFSVYTNIELIADLKAGSGAPTAGCVKASHPGHGNSIDCLAELHIVDNTVWYELPAEGRYVAEDGWSGAYWLTDSLSARAWAYSRLEVGTSPVTRTVLGAADWSAASFG